jgi:selenocysteine lyase/cysteine desulfurase
MLSCQKHLFSLPENEHYLNCAYMGPLLKTTEAAGIEGLQRKSVPRQVTPPDFFNGPNNLRRLFAQLVNADAEQVAIVPAVSYGVAIAAHNLSLRSGQNVVLPGEEFPSNVYAWMDQCARDGAELRIVDRPRDVQASGKAWNERILDAIDNDTAIVTLTAVHWTDGIHFDLEAIGQRAREAGALLLVDGTQSVGALPFDFQRVQPDLLVCAGYKWLLGPYQSGFAVLGERLIGGRPMEMSWMTREGSENFAELINYRDGFQPGARRFDVGETSNFINVPMLEDSLRQLLEWGADNIQAYCAELHGVLDTALDGRGGFTLNAPGECGAHLFGVTVPDPALIPAILEQLARRKVFVSQRGASLRVSPNVYNTPENMEALAEALLAAAK